MMQTILREENMAKGIQINEFLKKIADSNTEFVDFRFTDSLGIWHTITYHHSMVNEDLLNDGIMFDGSSIAGWRGIENSDMILMPDLNKGFIEPYMPSLTKTVVCDVYDPATRLGYNRDPRTIAKKAEIFLKITEIADEAYFGPEPEFFVFDEVQYASSSMTSYYYLGGRESTCASDTRLFPGYFEPASHGQQIARGKGYCQTPPNDHSTHLRSEMLRSLQKAGIKVVKHHHEVATSQHELCFEYDRLTATADHIQIYKYLVKACAREYGQSATFMPKPIFEENGSGMHVHLSLWKNQLPLFLGDRYCELSDLALYYIGGILKHARALNAFTNPTTNSYKRLVPGFEAPVYLGYAACNRSAAIRIPHTENKKAKRIEARFPDPMANPYLALSALLMAGLDGIRNKIHPGEASEINLYEENILREKSICGNLREALEALDIDRQFLKQGNVFDDDQLDAYIELKMREIAELDRRPHPVEFSMYYGG
jgi:glutamine synthetase